MRLTIKQVVDYFELPPEALESQELKMVVESVTKDYFDSELIDNMRKVEWIFGCEWDCPIKVWFNCS